MRVGVPSGFLCGCSSLPPCRCALPPLCGVQWLVAVCRSDLYGVRFALRRRVLGVCAPRGRAASAGVGGRWSLRRGMPFLRSGSWCPPRCPLSLHPGPCSLPFLAPGWFPAPTLCGSRCPVPIGACLSPWALPCPIAGVSLSAPRPPPARALSLPGVVVVGGGGRRWPRHGGGWPGAIGGGFGGCRGGGGPGLRPGGGPPMPPAA